MTTYNAIFSSKDVHEPMADLDLTFSVSCSKTYGRGIFRKGDHYMVMLTVSEMSDSAAAMYDCDSVKSIKLDCFSDSGNEAKEMRVIRSILRKNGLDGRKRKFSIPSL